jgi:hypothetical protein
MSQSAESLSLRRKRTASERAISNGDPLVVKKKAREATGPTMAAPALKNSASVGLHLFFRHVSDNCPYRQLTFVVVLLHTWKMMLMSVTWPLHQP